MLRTIHSTNQLSIYGAVSSWCDELAEQMHGQTSTGVDRSISEEMIGYQYNWIRKKLVLWCETNQGQMEPWETAWRDHLQRFGAGFFFKKTVCNGMYHRTGEDVNDGHGNFIASCTEYTLPRNHRDSEVKLWIQKFAQFRPVRDVKIICHSEVHGLEIQIPSTCGDSTNVWVVRYVNQLRYRDPEHSHEEADYECMQDTDQEQLTIQLESQYVYPKITFRFMNENGKTSLPMNAVTYTRGNLISQTLSENWYDMKIVETETEATSLKEIGSISFGKGRNNTRFQYWQNSCDK